MSSADSLHGTAEWTVVYVHAPSNITDYDAPSGCRWPNLVLSVAIRTRISSRLALLTNFRKHFARRNFRGSPAC